MSSGQAQLASYVPTEDLVAWYPFDGNAQDESGNAAHGTIHGATPTEDRNGVSSAALHFDGQSWVSASPLGLPNADAPRSVSAWLNPSTVAGPFTLTAVAYGAPSTSSAFMVGLYNQGIAVQGWADDFGTEVDYSADEWMHVVCTFAASSIKIYLNGVLIEEGENTTWNTMDGPLILGSRVDLANSYFEGSIDDVGIWSRALDPTEVVALYNGVTSVPGCTDAAACNFSEEANVDDGSCIACSVFAARCGEGTIWDDNTLTCVVANPADTDFDGCVQLNDLLDLLSAYGSCGFDFIVEGCTDPEAENWQEDANQDDGSCTYPFAPSESDELVFEYYLDFTGPSSCTTPELSPGEYYLEFSGTWCGGSCWNNNTTDAAYNINHPYAEDPTIPVPVCHFTWNEYCPQDDNNCASYRPTPDVYNPEHVYYYPFTSQGGSEAIYGVSDECCWGDNSGGLNLRVFKVN